MSGGACLAARPCRSRPPGRPPPLSPERGRCSRPPFETWRRRSWRSRIAEGRVATPPPRTPE
eukprot:5675538-Alexandrium_andersonii.AAC.1